MKHQPITFLRKVYGMQYPGVTEKEEQEGYISNYKGKVRCRQQYNKTPSPIKHISVSDYLKEKEKQNA